MNRQTQKGRVLAMLRTHGKYGVRSDRFLEVGIPRAAARILELRGEGHEISSEREKQFVRYRLVSVGVSTGHSADLGAHGVGPQRPATPNKASADPGGSSPEEPKRERATASGSSDASPGEPRLFPIEAGCSAYDPYSEAA